MTNRNKKDTIYLQTDESNKPQTVTEILKELKEKNQTKWTDIPKDDMYVQMNQYATNLTMPDKVREKEKEEYYNKNENPPATLELKLLKDKIKKVTINGTDYNIKQIITEPNGFQAIIFENLETGKSTLAIAGSYGVKDFFYNPAEWTKDWGLNNLNIAAGHLPPQLDTAINVMDKYKAKYNITEVTGFSLGAVLAGSVAKLTRNKDVNAYLYNGGLPTKLEEILYAKYLEDINPDSSNFITMLSRGETLTDYASIATGAGIYLARKGGYGHKLKYHIGLTNKDYELTNQSGMPSADSLNINFKISPNNGTMINSSAYPNILEKGEKKVIQVKDDSEIKNINKKIIKDLKKGKVSGFAEDLSEDSSSSDSGTQNPVYIDNTSQKKKTLKKSKQEIEAEKVVNKFLEYRKNKEANNNENSSDNFADKFFDFIGFSIAQCAESVTPFMPSQYDPFAEIVHKATVIAQAAGDYKEHSLTDTFNEINSLQLNKNINQEVINLQPDNSSSDITPLFKENLKSEILDELSSRNLFSMREQVENIMKDVFDDVIYTRGYKHN